MTQTKDEALKLALEVLQWSKPHKDAVITHSEAITAINAALAQDEASSSRAAQEPWCMGMNGCKTKCEDCPDEPAQEPVACVGPWHGSRLTLIPRYINQTFEHEQPLYTTPQQRPWVGLVNKDKVLDFGDSHVTTEFARGALWAEAKLKEMNT